MIIRKAEELSLPEDRQILTDIMAWKLAHGTTVDRLAELIGLSRTTMYKKLKDPERFTLREVRRMYQIIGV